MKSYITICLWLVAGVIHAGEPPKAFKPLGDLITLSAIPDAHSVSNIELVVAGNVTHGGTLDAAGFRRILQSASPASPDVATGWSFAPWYAGSFVYDDRKYKFGLYLGGLGTLTQPDGKAGLFRFKHPAQRTP